MRVFVSLFLLLSWPSAQAIVITPDTVIVNANYASTAELDFFRQLSGPGIGQSFEASGVGNFFIDGKQIIQNGETILVKNQSDLSQNGLYEVQGAGTFTVTQFIRLSIFDQVVADDLLNTLIVIDGRGKSGPGLTQNGNKFALKNTPFDPIGSSAVIFEQVPEPSTLLLFVPLLLLLRTHSKSLKS